MKLYLLLVIIALLSGINVSFAQKADRKDVVEILYFHGNQRCPTCLAIEKYTKEVVDANFSNQVKQSSVRFKVIDISTPEGERIADNYKVTWSSLFVNQWKNGKEVRKDLTQMAFRNARNNTPEFKKQLINTINESLK